MKIENKCYDFCSGGSPRLQKISNMIPHRFFGDYSRSSVPIFVKFRGETPKTISIRILMEKSENPKNIRNYFLEVTYPKVCQNFRAPHRSSQKKFHEARTHRGGDMSNYPVFKKSGFHPKSPARIRSKTHHRATLGPLYHAALNVSRSSFSGCCGPGDPL